MFNEDGKKVTVAGPSTPVQVLGLNGAPQAGDTFNVMADDSRTSTEATISSFMTGSSIPSIASLMSLTAS